MMSLAQTCLVFFGFGMFNMFFSFMFYVAVQDILAGSTVPTAVILASQSIQSTLLYVFMSYFLTSIPYTYRIGMLNICTIISYTLVAFADNIVWKLVGVAMDSFCYVGGQATFMGLTTMFSSEKMLSFYAIGTGFGSLASILYYTPLTTWLHVAPNITMITVAPLSIIYPIGYFLVTRASNRHLMKHNYQQLKPSDEDKETKENLTNKEKFVAIGKLFSSVAIPQFIVYVTKYSSTQSIITTIVFKTSNLPSRDYYQYYLIVFVVGEAFGRSFNLILSTLCPCLAYKVTLAEVWCMAILQVSHMLIYATESWYRYLPGVWSLLGLCFTGGVCSGIFSHDSVQFLSNSVYQDKEREFGMTYTLTTTDIGSMVASFVGLYLEPRLREHCILMMHDNSLCLTRTLS